MQLAVARPRSLAPFAVVLALALALGGFAYARHAQRDAAYRTLQRSQDAARRSAHDADAARGAYDRAFAAASAAERKRHDLALSGGWSAGGELAFARQEAARIRAATALHRRFVATIRETADRYGSVRGLDAKPSRATIASFDQARRHELAAWGRAVDDVIDDYVRRRHQHLAQVEASYHQAAVAHRAAEARLRTAQRELATLDDRLDAQLRLADAERRRIL